MLKTHKKTIVLKSVIILSFCLIGCSDDSKKLESDVFNDYLLGHLSAWTQSELNNPIPELFFEKDREIILNDEAYILPKSRSEGNRINLDDRIILDISTKVKLLNENNKVVEIEVELADSIVVGYIYKDDLIRGELGVMYDSGKEDLITSFQENRLIECQRIQEKYSLTDKEFYGILNREYYNRTGKYLDKVVVNAVPNN